MATTGLRRLSSPMQERLSVHWQVVCFSIRVRLYVVIDDLVAVQLIDPLRADQETPELLRQRELGLRYLTNNKNH